jgi:glycosyltransferase involved in cell wall biosynthesis
MPTFNYARRHARWLLFPSIAEGFGLPPLEAMAHGCPAICSHAASNPTVIGDADLLFDPTSIDEFSSGRSSWKACAENTARIYESLAN